MYRQRYLQRQQCMVNGLSRRLQYIWLMTLYVSGTQSVNYNSTNHSSQDRRKWMVFTARKASEKRNTNITSIRVIQHCRFIYAQLYNFQYRVWTISLGRRGFNSTVLRRLGTHYPQFQLGRLTDPYSSQRLLWRATTHYAWRRHEK
jgi:hypothetical protein